MEYITLVLAAVAVVLGLVVLSKVNKLITMLHTPIVKRVSDTNLKPNRHPVSAQEMTSRNNDRHDNGARGNDRRERGNAANAGRQERSFNRDRNGRGDRRGNDRRNDRRREFAPEATASAPVESAPVAPVAPAPAAPETVSEAPRTEGRRPLPPRVQATLPEVPAPTPVAPAAPAPAVEPENPAPEFEPSKVRYGRRNVMKKIPLEEESADEQPKA